MFKVVLAVFFSTLWALPTGLSACSPPPPPFYFLFNEILLHSEITEFTVNDQGYSATFAGGLVKENLNTIDSGDFRWVVLPAGETAEGISTGEAVVTMEPPANYIDTSLLAGSDVQARIQLISDQSGLVKEYAFASDENFHLFWQQESGEPLVSQILILIDGGTTETSMSRFTYRDSNYSIPSGDCFPDSGKGIFTPFFLGFLCLGLLIKKLLSFQITSK